MIGRVLRRIRRAILRPIRHWLITQRNIRRFDRLRGRYD